MLNSQRQIQPEGAKPSPLRALVVEDEWPARNYLVELLEASRLVDVVGAVSDAEEARVALTSGEVIDVAFVDIQLGAKTGNLAGLELVRTFAPAKAPMFVLATAYRQHALEAFDLGVVDYLLKPFRDDRVEHCLQRLLAHHSTRSPDVELPRRIVARRKKSLIFLNLHEVWAFEARERLTFVHTIYGTFDIDLSLAVIEASFGRTFTRVHRAWLVNLEFVREFERDGSDATLFVGTSGNGIRVQVARERAASLRSKLLANATGLRRL